MKSINKKNQIIIGITVIVFLMVMGIIAFLFLSPTFERVAPKVLVEKEIYWNLQKPIKVEISDNSEIKSYDVIFEEFQKQTKLETKVVKNEKGVLELEILPPLFDETYKPKEGNIKIDVYDASKWNFFKGNQTVTNSKLIIDKKSPVANVVTNSYLLRQGGSGIIIAEIADENIKDYYITFNDEEVFAQILQVKHPNDAKQLGRKVRNYDEQLWQEKRFEIVVQANLAKFSQHPELSAVLLATHDRILVEASPVDRVWGIGMAQDHEHIQDPAQWNGLNLLGFALMQVRAQLLAQPH